MTRAREFFEFLFGSIRDPWSWLFVFFVLAAWTLDFTNHRDAARLVVVVEVVTLFVLRRTRRNGGDQ